jgi:hypothetical protein
MTLLWGALAVLVVTMIVTESFLFAPVRDVAHRVHPKVGYLSGCFLCFGTWVGVGVGFLVEGPAHPVVNGLAFHGLAVVVHELVGLVRDVRTRVQR